MKIDPGWAEFNDATANIRGKIVAASGTFSGVFSADNVEAISELNIKNGAVSAYYYFDTGAGYSEAEFTLPKQQNVSVVDIVAPMRFNVSAESGSQVVISLWKNGVMVNEQIFSIAASIDTIMAMRYLDFDVSSETYAKYLLKGRYYSRGDALFLGHVVVGCRKR